MRKRIVTLLILLVLVCFPVSGQAAVNNPVFNAMTVNEKIAYLYGMIAQLQLLIDLRLEAGSDSFSGRNRSAVDIESLPARDIETDEAELRAEVDLNGEDEARVWFEYGEADDELDDRTSKRRVTDNRGDNQTISVVIDDLDEDERYYFQAVVEDEDGDRSYGRIRNFTTDDNGSSNSSSGDFDLDVSDTTIDEGDEIEVDWEIPDDETGSQNWIGLYEIGDSNQNFVEWVYIDDDDSGSETFEIGDEGEYEFRLFLDNSYNDEVTSEEIRVR